jgi:hypothetical protein
VNVLGIDPQPSTLAVCLREGHEPIWPPVSVDGGACAGERGAADGDAIDWSALERRVGAFIGDLTLDVGPRQTVIAGGAGLESASAAFGAVRKIEAGSAALVAALQTAETSVGKSVLTVVVNDREIIVSGYRLERTIRGVLVVCKSANPVVVTHAGNAVWVDEILTELNQRIPELPPRNGGSDKLRNAAQEMGRRLADATREEEPFAWNGPLVERLATPLLFTRRSSEQRWNSVRELRKTLPQAMSAVTAQLGISAADGVVVAGCGAVWSFVPRIAAEVAALLPLAQAELAVARGAAWWPEIGEALFRDGETAPAPRAVPQEPLTQGSQDIDLDFVARHSGPTMPPGARS